jgi:hypothetical protein
VTLVIQKAFEEPKRTAPLRLARSGSGCMSRSSTRGYGEGGGCHGGLGRHRGDGAGSADCGGQGTRRAMQVTLRMIADRGILRAQADTDMAVVGRATMGRYNHPRLTNIVTIYIKMVILTNKYK